MKESSDIRGWIVTFSGTAINLALGVLYSWSIIAKSMKVPVSDGGWGWSATQTQLPYAVACGVFAIMMVFAGRAQDKFGPRIVASIGGALTGLGLMVASLASANNVFYAVLGFGVMAGAGIGLGYASATPPAIKWFPPAKKGLISGLVVAGFGLASVYIAPLTTILIKENGINQTFLLLGSAFLVVSVIFAQFLKNPPAGYVPMEKPSKNKAAGTTPPPKKYDYAWHEMLKTRQFYLLWIMFALGAAAGLLTIGSLATIVSTKIAGASTDAAVLAEAAKWSSLIVAILAIANASGRVIAGFFSDLIGRVRTMRLVFFYQAICMLVFPELGTVTFLVLGSIFVGFNYGALLALFPSTTGDYFGTKNLGVNYGLVFTAWGFGGVFGPVMAGMIKDATGSFSLAFQISAALCLVAALVSFVTKVPKAALIGSPVEKEQVAIDRGMMVLDESSAS
ncbi:MAG: OFA family MFS transporter [Candidatus Aquicultor sp.]|nr:OFA family MFS transporter [Candidatus Aquicultor sp.]